MQNELKTAVLELTYSSDGSTDDSSSCRDQDFFDLMQRGSDNLHIVRVPVEDPNRTSLEATRALVVQLHAALRTQYTAVLCLCPNEMVVPMAQLAYFSTAQEIQRNTSVLFTSEEICADSSDVRKMSVRALNAEGMIGKVGILSKEQISAIPRLPQGFSPQDVIATWDGNWKFGSRKTHHAPLIIPQLELSEAVNGAVRYIKSDQKLTKEFIQSLVTDPAIAGIIWNPKVESEELLYRQLALAECTSIVVRKNLQVVCNAINVALTSLRPSSAYGMLVSYLMSQHSGGIQNLVDNCELNLLAH